MQKSKAEPSSRGSCNYKAPEVMNGFGVFTEEQKGPCDCKVLHERRVMFNARR